MPLYLIFAGGQAVFRAEQALGAAGIRATVGSAPPSVGGPCGLAIAVPESQGDAARRALAAVGLAAVREVLLA